MSKLPKVFSIEKDRLVVLGAAIVVSMVFVMAVFGWGGGEAESYSVPVPTAGFVWDYGEDLRITHAGSGSLADTSGQLVPVEIVEVETRDRLGSESGDTVTSRLYLTPDFRFIIFRDVPFEGGTDLLTFTWTAEPVPWLYGASEWFGANIESNSEGYRVQWNDASEMGVVDGLEISIDANSLDVERESPVRQLLMPGYANPHEMATLGSFMFEGGEDAPTKLVPFDDQGEKRDEIHLMGVTSIAPSSVINGRSLDDRPQPVNSSRFVPVHSFSWDHPFPFQEAWEVLQEEEDVPENFYITSISGGNPKPSEFRVELVVSSVVIDRQWTWDITVDTLEASPNTYRVTKIETAPMDTANYSYRVESWDKEVADVREIALVEQTIPLDELIGFVEEKTSEDFFAIGTTPYIEDGKMVGQIISVNLRPSEDQVSGFLPNLVFDAQSGYLTQGSLSPQALENLLFDGSSSGRS